MSSASSLRGLADRHESWAAASSTRSTERRRRSWRSIGKAVVTVERGLCRSQQVEGLEGRRGLLEVHADGGHIVLDSRIVSRRVRVGVRAPHRRTGVPLHAPIGSTCCKTRKRLIRRDAAPDRCSMRAGMCLSDRCCLSFRDEQQTRNKNSQRGCDLSDRG
jgi:hypothetical protein